MLILLAAVSCAPIPKVTERPPELAMFEQEIRTQLDKRKGSIRGFEAEADICIEHPGADYRGEMLIIGQGPSSIRLDCLGPFNQPVLSFATDGEHFALASILTMRYYEGNLASPVVASVIPAGIKMQDVYTWFLGGYDFKDRRLLSYSYSTSKPSLLVMEFSNERSDLREEVWLESSKNVIRKLVLKDACGNTILTAETDGLVEIGDFSYPGSVSFSLPSSGFRLSMAYKKMSLLSDAPPGAFSISCPPGFKYKTIN